jgi:heptosyltransferase-2
MLRALQSAGASAVAMVIRSDAAPLFRDHPFVSRVHAFDKRQRGATGALIEELRAARYDAAFIPHRSFRSAWIATRSGVPVRVGFRQSDAPWLLTDRVEYRITEHEVQRNARLVERIGAEVSSMDSWLVPTREAVAEIRRRFADRAPIVIAPGSVWPTKQWPGEGFVAVARRLQWEGRDVLLSGSPAERSLCEDIARDAGLGSDAVVAGELDLQQLLALLAIADRVITNDSAPLHLAESVGTPVTAIFGPTVPEFGFGPRHRQSRAIQTPGLLCRPCDLHGSRRCPIRTHECMKLIEPTTVLAGLVGAGRSD